MPDFVNFWTFNEKFLDTTASNIASENLTSDRLTSDTTFFYDVNDVRYDVVDTQSVGAEILIPLSIFKGKSCGRTVISYLKSKGLSFSDIARLLNRDPRTIWTAYKKASMESYFDDNDLLIPVNIFSYRGFSILESVVFWLKSEKWLNYTQIAYLLGKNYQTVRTVYKRALNKISTDTSTGVNE